MSSSSPYLWRHFRSDDLSAVVPAAFQLFADNGIVLKYECMVYAVLIALWLLVAGFIEIIVLKVASLAWKKLDIAPDQFFNSFVLDTDMMLWVLLNCGTDVYVSLEILNANSVTRQRVQ